MESGLTPTIRRWKGEEKSELDIYVSKMKNGKWSSRRLSLFSEKWCSCMGSSNVYDFRSISDDCVVWGLQFLPDFRIIYHY